ncbi:DUF3047 domain-containing protein [Candidatus Omnitrophota bacterium]
MRKIATVYIFSLILLILFASYTHAEEATKNFLFNKENSLKEWQEKVFKNKVLYTVTPQQEDSFLGAKSEEACSGLFYRVSFSPKKLPMISWYWKVEKFPEKSGVLHGTDDKKGWIEKDDYAARVYVIFPSLNFRRTKCLEYVWDKDLPEETIMTSPYFKNIKIIVAHSGENKKGEWIFEERNIVEDYKNTFGKIPKSKVGAVAIMTDTDNTLSTAEALYKNMRVGYKNE